MYNDRKKHFQRIPFSEQMNVFADQEMFRRYSAILLIYCYSSGVKSLPALFPQLCHYCLFVTFAFLHA